MEGRGRIPGWGEPAEGLQVEAVGGGGLIEGEPGGCLATPQLSVDLEEAALFLTQLVFTCNRGSGLLLARRKAEAVPWPGSSAPGCGGLRAWFLPALLYFSSHLKSNGREGGQIQSWRHWGWGQLIDTHTHIHMAQNPRPSTQKRWKTEKGLRTEVLSLCTDFNPHRQLHHLQERMNTQTHEIKLTAGTHRHRGAC